MGWQDYLAIGVAVLAGAYLLLGMVRGVRGSRTRAESCGTASGSGKQLVQIGTPAPRPPNPGEHP